MMKTEPPPDRLEFTLEEHRHRFAAWAAARASQRGFTTLGRLRTALEAAGVREALASPETRQLSPEEFDRLHRQWCGTICSQLELAGVPSVTYGRAAKLVAVYLKTIVLMGDAWNTPLGRNMHPPIDRILLQTIAAERTESPHASDWRRTNWTQLDESHYFELIGQLRATVPAAEPFWKLERHWQPSDVEGDEAVATAAHAGSRWLYIFERNERFPDPLEEIAFLAACTQEGKRVHLLLADRQAPPMAGARRGDEVVLCTRGNRELLKHGYAVIKAGGEREATTPEAVEPLYGALSDRTFIELEGVSMHEAGVVTELDDAALAKLLRGRAYVKRLAATSRGASPVPPPQVAEADDRRPLRVQSRPAVDTVVIGLDPTAGTWESGMTSGPKRMPSVAVVVRADGRIEAIEGCLTWHSTNEDFWARVESVVARTVAIDGPCATNGLRILDNWSGWDESARGGIRDGERELSRVGVGLYWTSHATVTRFDGASRWIARALKLFADAGSRDGLDVIETHPHGAFRFLGLATTGSVFEPKTTPSGRAQRVALLQGVVHGLTPEVLTNHDAIDAACAALVAALHVSGQTKAFGSAEGGGVIWMPDVRGILTTPGIESVVVGDLIEVGRSGVPAVPQSLADERHAWRTLTGSREAWEQTGTELSDEDLRSLTQGLIHYARASGRMIGGSASPVIALYREVVSRAPAWEPALTAWLVEHRTNPYEPFGTGDDFGATSWAEYSERQAERGARGAANMQAESERQAADRERRSVRDAAEATAQLTAAVRRGDLGAVRSLLDKGGDPVAALPGGASLVEWAERHGRSEVARYLRERGIR